MLHLFRRKVNMEYLRELDLFQLGRDGYRAAWEESEDLAWEVCNQRIRKGRRYYPTSMLMAHLIEQQYSSEQQERRQRKRELLRGAAAIVLIFCIAFCAVSFYQWLNGRAVVLTGREIVFHPVSVDARDALTLPEVYQKCRPWVVSVIADYVQGEDAHVSYGTGIVLTEDGYVVTCAHILLESEPYRLRCMTADGSVVSAVPVALDKQTDIAVLKLPLRGMEPAELGISDQTVVGETVCVIGNPLGIRFAETFTSGTLSARERTITIEGTIMSVMQTDAAINKGNSGGPLLNSRGQVIGMVNAKAAKGEEESVEGIGFAIPVDRLEKIAYDLVRYGYVQDRPWLGITMQEHTGELLNGLTVISVEEGSAAALAGVKPGDCIVTFQKIPITSSARLNYEKEQYRVGDTVTLGILRDGVTLLLDCTLQAMPGGIN